MVQPSFPRPDRLRLKRIPNTTRLSTYPNAGFEDCRDSRQVLLVCEWIRIEQE